MRGIAVGDTPMHVASQHGEKEMVAFLLKRGADMLARNQAGQTPFQSGGTNLTDRLRQPLLLLGKKDDDERLCRHYAAPGCKRRRL